jgi:hypothetical protein
MSSWMIHAVSSPLSASASEEKQGPMLTLYYRVRQT